MCSAVCRASSPHLLGVCGWRGTAPSTAGQVSRSTRSTGPYNIHLAHCALSLCSFSLSCTFGADTVECGSASVVTAAPALVRGTSVYSLLASPAGWAESEAECRAGEAHLASLASRGEEDAVMAGIGRVSDIWSGGNMCPDSPAPRHTLWTDGTPNEHTNFAADSGLAGGRCCVKAGRGRGWRGALCSQLLRGVCEARVERPLVGAERLAVQGGRVSLAVRWGRGTGRGWAPSGWRVRCCHIRSLTFLLNPDRWGLRNMYSCLKYQSQNY